MDCSLPGSSVHGHSPGKSTGVGCHGLLQRIFPIQGSNPGLPHCRWILYHLSHQGSPRILEWEALSLLQGNFPTQELNQGLLHCKQIHYPLSYQKSSYMYACMYVYIMKVFTAGSSGKESACQYRRFKRLRINPWVRKIPWRRAWQPTPVFLPGESHGQRNLMGYSPWSHRESDMTEMM